MPPHGATSQGYLTRHPHPDEAPEPPGTTPEQFAVMHSGGWASDDLKALRLETRRTDLAIWIDSLLGLLLCNIAISLRAVRSLVCFT